MLKEINKTARYNEELENGLKKSVNLFSLSNRQFLFEQILNYSTNLDCQPTVFARQEIDEAVKESLEIKTIIAETSNYQLDLAVNELILSKLQHTSISTLKRIRDNIKQFEFSPTLNLTFNAKIGSNIDRSIAFKLQSDDINPDEFSRFKEHVIQSFTSEGFDLNTIKDEKIKKMLKLCSEKSEEHNFDKIYNKITKINSLLKSIPNQESNTNINFANVFRLIVWFDEFKKSKDQHIESKLRYYISKLFTINIENIYNIFYELNDSRKSHLIDVFKIGLFNQSLEFDKAWNLIDNENRDLVNICINGEDENDLSYKRLAYLARSSGMNEEVGELDLTYQTNLSESSRADVINRLSDLAALGKLKEHFENALNVILKIFSEGSSSKAESYENLLKEYSELKGSLLPSSFIDGDIDFSTCNVFKPKTTFKASISYLVNYVKRKTLQAVTQNSDHNSMDYFWKSNNLIHLILYIMHKNVLMKSLYHETEIKYARSSFIDEFKEQEEFIDYGENENGVYIFGVNLVVDGEKIPCILQIPQIKSLESAIRKSLRKNTPPNQIFDMLRIRISLPLTVEKDKDKLDKCCEILTSYFMNKFGNTTFGETKYTMTGKGIKETSLGFKNLKLVLRYQFTHDKRAQFLKKLADSRILASLEEHSTSVQIQVINKITELLALDDNQISSLQEVDFGLSCSNIKGQVLNEILSCFDDVVSNEDNFIKVELQIVPTDTKKDEYDDHEDYSNAQMESIKKRYLPSTKVGLIHSIHFLTFNKFNNICEVPGLDINQTKHIYIQMMEFMVNLICENISNDEFKLIFEDGLYKRQIKTILERFLSEMHAISASEVELVTEEAKLNSRIIPLIEFFS